MSRRVYKHNTKDQTLTVTGPESFKDCDTCPWCILAISFFSLGAMIFSFAYGVQWMEDAYDFWRLNQDLKGSEPAKCQITWLKNYDCGNGHHIGIEAKGIADICIPHLGNVSIPWSGDVGPYDNCYKSRDAMLPYHDNGYTENMIVDCRADCQSKVWYTNEPYSNLWGLLLRGILAILFPAIMYCIIRYHKKCIPDRVHCDRHWIEVSNGDHAHRTQYLDRNQNPIDSKKIVKVGYKMKISGAQKYEGELVRVVEILENDKARVRFENSTRIIRIPIRCLKIPTHEDYYMRTEWQKAHLDLKQKIRGDWRNSDGLLISVEDDMVTFLPSTNSYRLCPFGKNRLKMKIGDAWWCYSNKSSEDELIWSNSGESVTWERRVIPPHVDDLPPSYEYSGLQVEMSAPPAYQGTDFQEESSAPPAYNQVGPSAPPAYQFV